MQSSLTTSFFWFQVYRSASNQIIIILIILPTGLKLKTQTQEKLHTQ